MSNEQEMSTTSSISSEDIKKIAELAKIRIDGDDLADVSRRLTSILAMVDALQAADTADVEAMANPLDATQRLRPDAITEGDRRAAFQAIAPAVENGLYLVPKVIE